MKNPAQRAEQVVCERGKLVTSHAEIELCSGGKNCAGAMIAKITFPL